MKNIYFRGLSYEAAKVADLVHQGHRATVATKDILTLTANRSFEARVAVQVDKQYHLLTGAIDKAAPSNALVVINLGMLKKALAAGGGFEQRQAQRRQYDAVTSDLTTKSSTGRY